MRISALSDAARDLRTSLRILRSQPRYVFVTATTLAIGIATSVVVFSIVDAVAFAKMPFDAPDRLVSLYERSLEDPDIDRWPVAPGNLADWRSMESFQAMAAYDYASSILTDGESARRTRTILVSGNTFDVLGASAALGRTIREDDERRQAPVVLLSWGFFQSVWGGDPSIIDRKIVLDGEPTIVVGVMSRDFQFPFGERMDIWRPLDLPPQVATDRTKARLFGIGRLRPGVSVAVARNEADALARALGARYPETNDGRGINVLTMQEDWLEWRLPALRTFSGAAALVLLIATLNLAGLQMSRNLARQGELAIRSALGASRIRIVWAALAEGFVIALIGAGLGTVIASRLLPLIIGHAPPGWAGAMLDKAGVNVQALVFAAVVGVGTVLLAGLAAVRSAMKGVTTFALRQARTSTADRSRIRSRRILSLTQTVLAVIALTEAGMLGRSLYNAFSYDVGFDHSNVFTARVPRDPEIKDPASFYRQLLDQVTELPRVRAAALASIAPLSGGGSTVAVSTDGSIPTGALDAGAYHDEVEYRVVDSSFFSTLGIHLLEGRIFNRTDAAGERVAVVNNSFARRILGEETEPLGATFRMAHLFSSFDQDDTAPLRVVGVVADIAEWGVWNQPPIVYVPMEQVPVPTSMTLIARTEPGRGKHATAASSPDGGALESSVRDIVWRLGSHWPVDRVSTLDQYEARLYRMNNFMLLVLGLFSASAVLLAAMGLYGVTSLQVGLRVRELSIRRALGATARNVLGSVFREGVTLNLVAVGIAGLVVAGPGRFLSDSWFGNFLYDVPWFDLVSFGFSAVLLTLTAVASTLAPALRAASIDPARMLEGGE